MAYDSVYDTDSSLAEIAGNYALTFNPETNFLNINGDGAIFGMFHNGGANCTVNGDVEIIDPEFGLYRFGLTFSLCQGFVDDYEGETMTGLGVLDLPGTSPGAFLLMITGVIGGRFEFFSVLYEPA